MVLVCFLEVTSRFCSETCEEAAAKRRAAISRRAIELEEMKLKRKRRRQMLELQHQKEKEALLQKAQLEDSMDDKSTSTGTPEVPQLPSSQPESSMDHQEAAPDTPADTGTPMSTAHNTPLPSPEPSDNEQEQEQEEESKRSESPPAPLLPWQFTNSDRRVQFSWPKYLEHLKARAAPTKLFADHGFPYQRNGFRPGMRLEGIDPRMPSQFCSYSVVIVRGYRMKLHYEGWPDSHDFWVNADSRDIFLIGFCEKTSRPLIPPRGYPKTTFNWASYLKLLRANSAPRQLFLHRSSSKISVGPSGFRVGMKLEAVDKHNPNLICVATVADILDGRILVHFDSWDRTYDYWAEPSSPYIHPVGWCEQNGRTLTPPNGYNTFDWDSYLKETKSTAVPSRAFKPKPPPGFKKGMKLECVDPRFPEIIRVSTVNDCKEHRVQISFDGWPIETAVWVDADSPDIHPMGWCNKTGHPLTPPPGPNQEHPCMTTGCRALLKNSQFILPHSSGICPLATVNLNKAKKGVVPTLPFYYASK
ncbi:hypothetical protein B566_EDAN008690 [Ephemera danica]|nr:hypothetical protein B566_EDAN008690 [Ephemera danica]